MRALVIFVVLLVGCSSAEIKHLPKPKVLIPKEKMILLIKDMTVMEAYIQQKYPSVQQNYKVMGRNADEIFKKHQVDSIQYKEAFAYYGSRQDEMQEIYSKALELVNRELAEVQAKN